jgi:hypothetical protein
METVEILEKGIHNPAGTRPCKQWEIPVQGPVEYSGMATDLHPYLMGLWLCDGTRGYPCITKNSKEVIERLRKVGYKVNQEPSGRVYISGIKGLIQDGVFQKNSPERYIPSEYKYNTVENRKELFRGLCDGDAEVTKSQGINFSSTSKKLANDVIWLARSLGYKAWMQRKIKQGWYYDEGRKRVDCKKCYRVNIAATENPFTIKHRKTRWKKPTQARYLHRWIESIKKIGDNDGMCVIVDNPEHLHLANDFIVTHNTASLVFIIIWFLFCHKDAQVGCTAPTTQQMHDVLWKEIQIWLNKLPPKIAAHFQWSTSYLRIAESPSTWFARAITARKENPDSLAGLHGDFVLCVGDESSGIPDQVFNIGEGSFTGENKLFIMVSNYRRLTGYFHRAFTKERGQYQTAQFDSSQSPVVKPEFLATMLAKGEDSDDYRVEVAGRPPNAETVDDKGYVPLLQEKDLRFTHDDKLVGERYLGVDPAGEGRNETLWVLRDSYKARIVDRERVSNEKSIASKTILLAQEFDIKPEHVYVDAFGVGDKTVRELYMSRFYAIAVNTSDVPDDKTKFFNKRAEISWRAREWLRSGGELVGDISLWEDFLDLRYTVAEGSNYGKIKMMSKKLMKDAGLHSPDCFDAACLTFITPIHDNVEEVEDDDPEDFDPHFPI